MTKVMAIRETAGRRRVVALYRSTGGTLYARSQSHPNTLYNLGAQGDHCQCPGFQHRGRCKHVEAAALFTRLTAPQSPAAPRCERCGERPADASNVYPTLCLPCSADQCAKDLWG